MKAFAILSLLALAVGWVIDTRRTITPLDPREAPLDEVCVQCYNLIREHEILELCRWFSQNKIWRKIITTSILGVSKTSLYSDFARKKRADFYQSVYFKSCMEAGMHQLNGSNDLGAYGSWTYEELLEYARLQRDARSSPWNPKRRPLSTVS